MGYNRVVKKREYAALLLLAGGNRRPHPLVVSHSRFTACALRNPSVDDAVTDLLFAMIVRRLYHFGEHETKVILRHADESFCAFASDNSRLATRFKSAAT